MGRRPGPSRTREQILAAARASFAKHGYEGTSIRAVARKAGVDPALVRRFFGSKEQLLVAAFKDALPGEQLDEVVAGDLQMLGERAIAYMLSIWEVPANRQVLLGMVRTATTNPRGATLLRNFIGAEVLRRLADRLDPSEAQLRASLVGSQMIGLIFYRYVLELEPLASASPQTLSVAFAPTLQRYLTGRLD